MAAASLVPGQSLANQILAPATGSTGSAGYPPALTGMRGNHDGSFDVVHQLALEARRDGGPTEEPDSRVYDLVVVGAGISGLAAAYFYRQANPNARILILDNHDDFGGHARRNEFNVAGRRLIGYGGCQSLEAPSGYSDVVKSLLRDLDIDVSRFDSAYDQDFYKRHGLAGGVVFNREDWGVDRLVRYDIGGLGGYLPLAPSDLSAKEAVQQMPMSDAARKEMLRLLTVDEDQIPEVPADDKYDYLYTLSYRDFLSKHVGISEPQCLRRSGTTSDTRMCGPASRLDESLSPTRMPALSRCSRWQSNKRTARFPNCSECCEFTGLPRLARIHARGRRETLTRDQFCI